MILKREDMKNYFFKDEKIPYIEIRKSEDNNLRYKEHFHCEFSIGALIKGTTILSFENKKYHLNKNELAVFNPFELHSCNPYKNQKRSYYMMYVDTQWLFNLQKNIFEVNEFIPIKSAIIKSEKYYFKFIFLCEKIIDSNVLYLEQEALLEEFFSEIFINFLDKKRKKETFEIEKLKKAKKYIEKYFYKNITLFEISQHCELSPYHFSRSFKKAFGISPHKFLMNMRIEKAKKLLKEKSIVDVAYEVGFYDQSHFHKVFKSYTAATPFEYKNYTPNF